MSHRWDPPVTYPIDRVRAAVREYVAAQADGVIGLYAAEDGAAKALGLPERSGRSMERLRGQVYRTLNQMADGGELVKSSKGGSRSMPAFYTPAAYEAKQATDAAEAAAREDRRRRWADIHDQVTAWGMTNTNTQWTGGEARGRPVHLKLDDMEALVARARRGSDS